jgi:hypothetical protein
MRKNKKKINKEIKKGCVINEVKINPGQNR